MKVEIMSYTEKPLEVIYSGFRRCYSGDDNPMDAFKKYDNFTDIYEAMRKLVSKGVKAGHYSPLEHVSFIFRVSGISRVCSHQLVRHRIASYSQLSQRYVYMDKNKIGYVIPEAIENNSRAKEIYVEAMNHCFDAYRAICNHLSLPVTDFRKSLEKGQENARYILPSGVCTDIIITMNCRSLIHFFSERLCSRAQDEIRQLAAEMLKQCRFILPAVFDGIGAKCDNLGYCPEEKGCGRRAKKE